MLLSALVLLLLAQWPLFGITLGPIADAPLGENGVGPEPGALMLLGLGLVGIAGLATHRSRKAPR
jgi:hypothetical protein